MIYVFLANGVEDIEGIATIDILRRAGLDVVTVGVGSREIRTSHGITLQTDISEADVEKDKAEMVVLPGGKIGTINLEKSTTVKDTVIYCFEHDRYVCAICAAPSILGHLGILKNRKATCFPGFEKELLGAEVTGEYTVTDGKIITGKGAGASIEFALQIIRSYISPERADELGRKIEYPVRH
jgi:4-methyl-5(b-hydroxyethyl)-thiazole monophosphate biosynthesis